MNTDLKDLLNDDDKISEAIRLSIQDQKALVMADDTDKQLDEIFTLYNQRKSLPIKNLSVPYKAREEAKQSLHQLIQSEILNELKLLKTKKVKGANLLEMKWIDKRINQLKEGKV